MPGLNRTPVIAGAPAVYIREYTEYGILPDPVVDGVLAWDSGFGWTRLGHLDEKGGVKVKYKPEYLDVRVQEYNSVIKKFLIKQDMTIEMVVDQTDTWSLYLLFANASYSYNSSFSIPDGGTLTEFAMGWEAEGTQGPGSKSVVFLPRVACIAEPEVIYAKEEVRRCQYMFQVLVDTTRPASENLCLGYEIAAD